MLPPLFNGSDFDPQCFIISDHNTDFNDYALNLFSSQYHRNTVYQSYCDSIDITPCKINDWHSIPAVTTDTFKLLESPIIAYPANDILHTFTTSGTTQETKGQHHFPSLKNYEQSIIQCWEQLSLPKPENCIFLTPKPEDSPNSSLAHMMGVLDTTYSATSIWAINHDGGLNIQAIKEAQTSEQPIALLGTALAFLHLFENLSAPLDLPTGSWAMETGGYKGTQTSLNKEELYEMFHRYLGIKENTIINEYSMTELSSQFYTQGIGKKHTGPSWTRIRVIDPVTGKDAPKGGLGYLVIYDLANVHSVMAIRTQDIAIAHDDRSFTLIGRDPSALPRGCSRSSDAVLNT